MNRRATRPLAMAAGLALVALAVPTAATTASAAAPEFVLVAQSFNVPADGVITMTLGLPAGVAPPTGDFRVLVTALRPVETRDDVAEAIAGDLPGEIDTVELLPLAVPQPPGQLQLTVPIEVTSRTKPALQMSRPAVYPVHVQLEQDGELAAELLTFVNRVPNDLEGADDPLPLAFAVTTVEPVTMDDDARVVVDQDAVDEIEQLTTLLEDSPVPLAVSVAPSVLATIADRDADGADLVERFDTAMERHDLLSSPILPLDVSLAAAADQSNLYTQWLRDGEDALAQLVTAPAQRTIDLFDTPLSQAGGGVLRNLGARMLVVPADTYDGLPESLGGFTDTTQLVQLQVAPDVTVDAAIVDRVAGLELGRPTDTPLLTAIEMVADLLAVREQVEFFGGDPRRHSITLATPDFSLPDLDRFAAFTDLLVDTPGLRPTTLDDLSVRTDQLLGPEGPVVVQLPDTVPGDLQPRFDLANALGLEAVSTASMLPDDDERMAEWSRLISVLPTTALSDAQADDIATSMRDEFQTLKDSVGVPAGFSFNLTGRTGSVPITLRNDADIPLKVRLRMSSSKLVPRDDEVVELAPNSFTEVKMEIEARSNGDLPVSLEVFTPVGDVRLAPPVPLTATVNALAGVANLITGAALLVLLSWWMRHISRTRRARRAAEAAHRHPATTADTPGDGPGDTPAEGAVDPDDLSPDAATSTLPPS